MVYYSLNMKTTKIKLFIFFKIDPKTFLIASLLFFLRNNLLINESLIVFGGFSLILF